jgi:hypothetical protein
MGRIQGSVWRRLTIRSTGSSGACRRLGLHFILAQTSPYPTAPVNSHVRPLGNGTLGMLACMALKTLRFPTLVNVGGQSPRVGVGFRRFAKQVSLQVRASAWQARSPDHKRLVGGWRFAPACCAAQSVGCSGPLALLFANAGSGRPLLRSARGSSPKSPRRSVVKAVNLGAVSISQPVARPNHSFNRKQWGMPLSGPPFHYGPASVIPHCSG